MRSIVSAASIVLGAGIALGACGGELDGPGPSREPASSLEQASLTSGDQVLWFRWSKGEAAKVLVPHTTHICGLSMVRGELARNTTLRISKSGGNWVMGGENPGSNFLQMDAMCEPLSAFQVNSGITPASRSEFLSTVTSSNTSKSVTMSRNLAPVMTGLKGELDGGGEKANIILGPDPVLKIKVEGAPGTHAAYANSVYLGEGTPFYVHDFRPTPSFSESPNGIDVGCDFEDCDSIATLATSFCYLTSVSGNFRGADEWVGVFPDRNRGLWTMDGHAGSGSLFGSPGSVYAQAQCLLLDQRRSNVIIR